jgi:hypothetical protein
MVAPERRGQLGGVPRHIVDGVHGGIGRETLLQVDDSEGGICIEGRDCDGGCPWSVRYAEVSLDDAPEQPDCRGEFLLLSRGEMRTDRLRKPVFAGGPAGLDPAACRLCQREHDLPAVGGIGRSADRAGLLLSLNSDLTACSPELIVRRRIQVFLRAPNPL